MKRSHPTKPAAPTSAFNVVIDQYGRKVWTQKQFIAPKPPKEESETTASKPEKVEVKTLRARTERLDLEKNVGKAIMVTTDMPKNEQPGFHCDVCDTHYTDSASYLDHINGRKHNQRLGISMKVEKVGAERVKQKLRMLKEKEKGGSTQAEPTFADIEKKLDKEEEETKKKRKKKKEDLQLEEALDFDAKEIVAFGLPGDFGSSKKKK